MKLITNQIRIIRPIYPIPKLNGLERTINQQIALRIYDEVYFGIITLIKI